MSFLNSLLGRVKNTVNNDIVKPIQRDVVQPATTAARNTGGAIAATNRFLNTAGTGVERSLIGTAQAGSGLYDLASRGTGTNRFSKALHTKALAVDAHAKTLPFSAAYKGGQLTGDLATFAVPGGAIKAAAKVPTIAKATAKVADVASHIPSPVAKATTKLVQGNIGQRVVGKTIQTATNPTLTAANAAFTAMQAGKEASQGKQVTPLNTAANFAIGQVGFPLAGHAAGEVAAPVINKGIKELRSAHLIKPTSLSDAELAASQKVIKQQTGWGDQGITADDAGHFHNAQMKLGHEPGTPEAATAVQDALLQHQAYESAVAQRKQAVINAKEGFANTNRLLKENQGGYIAGPKAMGFAGAKKNGRVFEGVDGKPRFEVSDESAKIGNLNGKTLAEVLDHPQLYSQYPELRNVQVIAKDLPSNQKGAFQPVYNSITINKNHTPEQNKATLLHELQHAIQNKEGFANGANLVDSAKSQRAIQAEMDKVKSNPTYQEWRNKRDAVLNDPQLTADQKMAVHKQMNDNLPPIVKQYQDLASQWAKAGTKGMKDYVNNAGEAEARAVEARMNMKGGERYVPQDLTKIYHGTDKVFKKFDVKKAADGGIWFTTRKDLIEKGEVGAAGSGRIMERFIDENNLKLADWKTVDRLTDMEMEWQGYDGYALKEGGETTFKLFDPNKVTQAKPGVRSTFYDSLDVPKDQLIVKTGDSGVVNGKAMSIDPTAAETPATPTPTQSRAVAPTTKLVAQPAVQDGSLADNTPKTARFTTSVQHSPEASAEVRQAVGASYVPGNNAEVVGTAKDQIAQQGLEPILNQTLTELGGERGTASRDSLATAIELAKQHDALGTPEAQATAAHLYDLVAEHGSAKGQGAQILATIARNSPAGLRNKAFRDLKKAGVDVTPEIQKEIQGHINAISTMKDGPAKDMAIAVLQKAVSKHLPQSIGDRAISLWKAGLLSGVKTQQGNAISNGTFAGLKKVSDIPATAADKLMALKTGERTKTITFSGAGSGTKEGFKNAGTTLKTGIDPRNIGDKYEQHAEINFGSKILQNVLAKPANMIFRGMSAADQPFWYSALKNSLYDQAKADGINKGLRGKALLDHMNKTVANPTEKMADVATNEANKSTLNFDTVGSKAIQAVHKGIDNMPGITPAGKSVAHGVINVLAPFTKVPTAFITRTVDFTPLGITKEVFHQIAGKEFNQRALAQAIGEGLTGTGVIALGMTLANKGQLSGDYPKNDQKEQQRWKAEGITPNSVKVGGKWINMNYLGPVGLLFNAGHQLTTAKSESALNQVGATIGGLGQGLLGQSFLQGFTGFSDAMKDPARNGKSFVNSQASSVVPSIVNDVANVTDKFQRQADNVSQSIKNRVPGLRETNAPKQDIYGNTLKQAGGQLNTLNGLKPSNSLTNSNPVIAEVNRLHSVDPNNNDLQVTPTPVGKSITLPAATKGAKGATINLNDKQRYDLQKQVGQATQDNWGKLIKTPEYQAMSDADKAKKLTSMRQDATEFTTRKYVVDNNLGTYDKPAGSGAVALAKGDISKYTSSSSGASSTADYYKSPDAEYKSIQDSYNKKAKVGWNSQAEKIKADKQLASAKVGSKFDKAIRDAHALSNADLYDLVHNDKNGNDIVKKVLAYDDALTNAGVQSKNKFRNKYGNVTIGSASVAKSSGGKGGSKATGSKEATQFAAALAKKNSAAKSSQDALLSLVKNAHVSAPRAAGSKATVANVTLKKQSVKQNKVKAIA